MRSNIEQAVADVIASNKEVALANVFDAYTRIAGLTLESAEAVIAFERALDKHPDSKEKLDSASSRFVAEVRRDYLRKIFAEGGRKPPACPCCADLVQHMMNGNVEKVEEMLYWPGKAVEGTPKKSKKRQHKKKRAPRKAVAFDPYGPSTSACRRE